MINASAKLLDITRATSDRQVAMILAEAMLERDRVPYWFSINHDIRPPKCLACPLDYDWSLKGRVGIKTLARTRALKWITDAALAGYEISREGGRPLTSSLVIARRRAEYHQTPDDDDIPF